MQPTLVKTADQLRARVINLCRLQVEGDPERLRELDVLAAVPQTEVWAAVATDYCAGGWAVAQGKIAAYDIDLPDYPANRVGMRGGDAARLIRRWGRELPEDHPAYAAVHALAAKLGTAPRRTFTVVEVDAPSVVRTGTTQAAPGHAELAALAAIEHLVPLLSGGSRERLMRMLTA